MYALETVGDSSVSLRPKQKACRECVLMARMLLCGYLPDP